MKTKINVEKLKSSLSDSAAKPILIHYVNVGNIDPSDVDAYVKKTIDNITPTSKKKDAIFYFIVVRNESSRIECISEGKNSVTGLNRQINCAFTTYLNEGTNTPD